MIVKDDGMIESESEHDRDYDDMPALVENGESDEDVFGLDEG